MSIKHILDYRVNSLTHPVLHTFPTPWCPHSTPLPTLDRVVSFQRLTPKQARWKKGNLLEELGVQVSTDFHDTQSYTDNDNQSVFHNIRCIILYVSILFNWKMGPTDHVILLLIPIFPGGLMTRMAPLVMSIVIRTLHSLRPQARALVVHPANQFWFL